MVRCLNNLLGVWVFVIVLILWLSLHDIFGLSFLSHLLVASVSPSVRLSTLMSTFDIYVKVSILINYKTKQPSNLAWNISLTSWLCNIGVRFSICLSIRPSVCQPFMSKFDIYVKVSILINYKTEQPSDLAWNISLTSRLCDIGAHFSIRLSVPLSVCPSLNSSVMSKFDIYVKVSILINYKTKQPSNLVWNISLTSWLCDIGARFSIRPSVRPSVRLLTVLLCRSSTFTSKLVF